MAIQLRPDPELGEALARLEVARSRWREAEGEFVEPCCLEWQAAELRLSLLLRERGAGRREAPRGGPLGWHPPSVQDAARRP